MLISEETCSQTLSEKVSDQESDQEEAEYGCVFCLTGREHAVAQRLERSIPGLKAISPVKLRYRRMDGVAHEESVTLFPGYVFFKVQVGFDIKVRNIYTDQDVLKVLYTNDETKEWRLVGLDKKIVIKLFNMKGVVGFSDAWFDEGGAIHIINGFLKGQEANIRRVNKRAKTAEVALIIGGKKVAIWLGYEEIEAR